MTFSICRAHQVLACNRGRLNVLRSTRYLIRRSSTASPQRESAGLEPSAMWASSYPEPADDFWRAVPVWKDVSEDDFMSWSWGVKVYPPLFSLGSFQTSKLGCLCHRRLLTVAECYRNTAWEHPEIVRIPPRRRPDRSSRSQ